MASILLSTLPGRNGTVLSEEGGGARTVRTLMPTSTTARPRQADRPSSQHSLLAHVSVFVACLPTRPAIWPELASRPVFRLTVPIGG